MKPEPEIEEKLAEAHKSFEEADKRVDSDRRSLEHAQKNRSIAAHKLSNLIEEAGKKQAEMKQRIANITDTEL